MQMSRVIPRVIADREIGRHGSHLKRLGVGHWLNIVPSRRVIEELVLECCK
jgi:hypothetical protein